MRQFIFILLILFFITSCRQEPALPAQDIIPIKEILFEGAKAKGRVWVQKEFVLSTFNGIPAQKENFPQAIANLKAASFNYIETAWRSTQDTKDILQECDKQGGIKVIAQDMATLGGFAWFTIHPYHEDSISKVLNNFGHYKSLGGIYVYDEPKQEEFHIVRDNTNSIEKRRPDLLSFTVLLQSYSPWYKWDDANYVGFDTYVDRYMDDVAPAVLSSDYYPIHNHTTNESFSKDNFWRDLSYLRKKTLEKDALFWFYYQSVANNANLEVGYMTASQISVQAWAAILYGAKGLQSYCAIKGVIDTLGNRGSLFDDVATINKQISEIGNTLLALKSKAVYHGSSIVNDPLANRVDNSKYIYALSEFLSVGEFSDAHDNDYLLILNRNFHQPYKGAIPLREIFRTYRCGQHLDKPYLQSNILPINLDAGQAILFRIEDITKDPYIIKYVIK